ncbi:glutamine synthetase catalytic region [Mycolicibacterium brisbanense]|uniref:Glutamine synthetase catalytic region n=2 Tax=Mycolicibacterium brisbanense TaxID=146020 RepID=A0A117I3X6_9MYCO|nr:glutamine synthetase catalytic region [Mycolicibacterium brisbanense]
MTHQPPANPKVPQMSEPTAFIATCDLAAIVRGRAVPASRLTSTLTSGVGWVPADLALTCFGNIAPDNMFGSVGDLRLVPDATAFATLAETEGRPATVLYVADQTQLDGSPWGGCPRTALKDAIAALEDATGLTAHASFEHEFMVGTMTGAPPFSFERARGAEPFGSALVAAVEGAGLEPESWLPEYGEGQFEVPIAPTCALLAADRAVLLREVIRDVARGHGHRATFTPLARPDGVGNGVHIHISLYDASGAPVLYDPQRPGKLSQIGARFAAGVLAHADALVAITAPSPVSFLRLAPHRWSAGGAFLAERNREALLRICPTIRIGGRDEAAQLHLEYRAADATANPWLALAALLRAGLAGLSGDEEARVWPETATEAELAEVPALPGDLASALDALARDEVAQSWFGTELIHTFQLVKRAELEAVGDLDPAGVCRRIAEVY